MKDLLFSLLTLKECPMNIQEVFSFASENKKISFQNKHFFWSAELLDEILKLEVAEIRKKFVNDECISEELHITKKGERLLEFVS